MTIDSYSFGKIKINGKDHTADLIIFTNRINSKWWRKEGHLVRLEDLEEVLVERPEILIIGSGYYGLMRVDDNVVEKFGNDNISVIVLKTQNAVDRYNSLFKKKKVAAALHLTC
ncbi:MAG: hypothetical protein H8E57_01655 [Candidatus Cloacimonetes bacterium]|nr:hypothetical protein [Candidatus Cloacimonadota bacterium]